MLKIAYLYQLDASNPAVQSGRPASILRNLSAQGAAIHEVFPMATQTSRLSMLKKLLYRLAGRYYRGDREPKYLSAIAAEFDRRTRGINYDIAFCPGSEAVSHLEAKRPIVFCADATFANMIDYYWDFSSLSSEYVRKGHLQEANALRRAALAIYPSEWAARSAINFYHAEPDKVAIIPFGANLGSQNSRDQVHQWIAGRRHESLRLLFVGRSWKRKGGDLVVETAKHLVQRGLRVTLDVVSRGSRTMASWIQTRRARRRSLGIFSRAPILCSSPPGPKPTAWHSPRPMRSVSRRSGPRPGGFPRSFTRG